jgi:ABC-type Mn2+/Zn2+ transport system permease subunit
VSNKRSSTTKYNKGHITHNAKRNCKTYKNTGKLILIIIIAVIIIIVIFCYVEAKCSTSDPDSNNIYGSNSEVTITKSKET